MSWYGMSNLFQKVYTRSQWGGGPHWGPANPVQLRAKVKYVQSKTLNSNHHRHRKRTAQYHCYRLVDNRRAARGSARRRRRGAVGRRGPGSSAGRRVGVRARSRRQCLRIEVQVLFGDGGEGVDAVEHHHGHAAAQMGLDVAICFRINNDQ